MTLAVCHRLVPLVVTRLVPPPRPRTSGAPLVSWSWCDRMTTTRSSDAASCDARMTPTSTTDTTDDTVVTDDADLSALIAANKAKHRLERQQRLARHRQSQPPGQSVANELHSEALYRCADGHQHVLPYYFTYSTHAKQRHIGRSLLSLFHSEFVQYSAEYYASAVRSGRVTVNYRAVTGDYVIGNGDRIDHHVHRHENAVSSQPITIQLFPENDVIIVDKPASVPVHPTGRYRHNSLLFILRRLYGIRDIYTVHRLDRVVSGLLLIATNKSTATTICSMIENGRVRKLYVARVGGRLVSDGGTVVVRQPIHCQAQAEIQSSIDAEIGKDSETRFTPIDYDAATDTSLVLCQPVTGRTHQIRIHCQHLGHPIVNDRMYGGRVVSVVNHRDIEAQLKSSLSSDRVSDDGFRRWRERVNVGGSSQSESEAEREARLLSLSYDPHCQECHGHDPYRAAHTHSHADASAEDDDVYEGSFGIQQIYLHALRYEAVDGSWRYSVDLPPWAANASAKIAALTV